MRKSINHRDRHGFIENLSITNSTWSRFLSLSVRDQHESEDHYKTSNIMLSPPEVEIVIEAMQEWLLEIGEGCTRMDNFIINHSDTWGYTSQLRVQTNNAERDVIFTTREGELFGKDRDVASVALSYTETEQIVAFLLNWLEENGEI